LRARPASLAAGAICSALLLSAATPIAAQPDTLAGKSVQMIIGFGPGGGYDL
jgi:tripartite-type tricarboxylate transporter receptor subunit TctC